MANYQSNVNNDDSITLTVKTSDGILFGLSTEEIETLPEIIHKNLFVAAGTVEKVGYQFRTKSFDKPSEMIPVVKQALDLIKLFITNTREIATGKSKLDALQFQFGRQEKLYLQMKQKRDNTLLLQQEQNAKQQSTTTEIVKGVAVTEIINGTQKLVVGDAELDSFNAMMMKNLKQLPDSITTAQQLPVVIKATFTTYYLLADGATKVQVEYSV